MSNEATSLLHSSQVTTWSENGVSEDDSITGLVEKNGVIIHSSQNSSAFDDWWITTEWGMQVALEDSEYRKPNWGSESRSVQPWSMFEEGAYRRSGKPVVMCMLCDCVLAHPNNKTSGSGNLARHLRTSKCRKSATTRPHLSLPLRVQDMVSSEFIYMNIIILKLFLCQWH
jgi:hypothetical protein